MLASHREWDRPEDAYPDDDWMCEDGESNETLDILTDKDFQDSKYRQLLMSMSEEDVREAMRRCVQKTTQTKQRGRKGIDHQ